MKNAIIRYLATFAIMAWAILDSLKGLVLAANTETVYPIDLRTVILGGACYFTKDGETETITAVQHTVGDAYVPLTGSSLFKNIGEIERANVTVTAGKINLKSSASGRYRDKGTIYTSQSMAITGTIQSVSEMVFQDWLKGPVQSSTITLGTAFAPMRMTSPLKGWLKMTAYDSTAQQMLEVIVRVEMEFSGGVTLAESQYQVNFMAKILEGSVANAVKVIDYTAYAAP